MHDDVGSAQRHQWLLRHGRILPRSGLPACPTSRENHDACEKSGTLRVRSIHHDSRFPERLATSITGGLSGVFPASPRKPRMHRPANTDGFRPISVSSQLGSVSRSNRGADVSIYCRYQGLPRFQNQGAWKYSLAMMRQVRGFDMTRFHAIRFVMSALDQGARHTRPGRDRAQQPRTRAVQPRRQIRRDRAALGLNHPECGRTPLLVIF